MSGTARALVTLLGILPTAASPALHAADPIPLPEHPRPDFERHEWLSLNGPWSFRFDAENAGESAGWAAAPLSSFSRTITVPFSWGSKLSGLASEADIGWYARTVRAPSEWKGKRVFLRIGACDWVTTAWLDGKPLGRHRGGYTPFEFELTPGLEPGKDHLLVLRVDDTPHPFKLEGKQGYGPARGIWQTAWLEARPAAWIESIRFTPDVDAGKVEVLVTASDAAQVNRPFALEFMTGGLARVTIPLPKGEREVRFEVPVPQARLWSPQDPFLYEVEASLGAEDGWDRVRTYFGMRKFGVGKLPGTEFPYVTLNGKPFYLQMALDQSYHPDGFYTFPSDQFMRDEVLRSLRIGLNAIRVHVKLEVPRKLYWADRLGLLVMEDVPNSWGEPDAEMRSEVETALRGMIARDFNHPAIFSWVVFNETWGLKTGHEKVPGTREGIYTPETQDWVASMWRLAKSLDPTRLVEDNSACNNDHVATDLQSWHVYLPGYAWREHLDQVTRDAHPGSPWNFIGGRTQGAQPLLNSESGNVWGYEGSTGDVDWSWDYHIMMNEFRRHPKVGGWLYTEQHDVINEWNGYYRFDRSPKYTGLGAIVAGMSLLDLHGPFYIAPGTLLCQDVKPGAVVEVPLWASFLTDAAPARVLKLRWELRGWDDLGREETWCAGSMRVGFHPWMSQEIEPLQVSMPTKRALAVLSFSLEDPTGLVLHRNFTTFHVTDGQSPREETAEVEGRKARILRFDPAGYRKAEWTLGKWDVLDGMKANGAGSGFFEYAVAWPADIDPSKVIAASFRAELSAKRLLGKDQAHAPKQEGDFMRGKGTLDPSANPNSYPMTDSVKHPSVVRVRVAGVALGTHQLENDPADHRGILSWHSQKTDKHLHEAGSYGWLVADDLPREAIAAAAKAGEIVVRLEVDPSLPGGLAVYGETFGRYPLDPTLVLILEE